MADRRLVPTPSGDAGVRLSRARSPVATLVLGHGAGGAAGSDARDLVALAALLPRQGITVVRVDQPWRVAGKRVAPASPVLDAAFTAVVNSLRPRTPLVVGGRSSGARVACRTARSLGASGCLALAFPLRPPRQSAGTRVDELTGAGVATLVVQGERDAFGGPDEFPASVELAVIPGADHSFAVAKAAAVTQEEALEILVEAALEWIIREIA